MSEELAKGCSICGAKFSPRDPCTKCRVIRSGARREEYERVVSEIRKLPNYVAVNTVLEAIAPNRVKSQHFTEEEK